VTLVRLSVMLKKKTPAPSFQSFSERKEWVPDASTGWNIAPSSFQEQCQRRVIAYTVKGHDPSTHMIIQVPACSINSVPIPPELTLIHQQFQCIGNGRIPGTLQYRIPNDTVVDVQGLVSLRDILTTPGRLKVDVMSALRALEKDGVKVYSTTDKKRGGAVNAYALLVDAVKLVVGERWKDQWLTDVERRQSYTDTFEPTLLEVCNRVLCSVLSLIAPCDRHTQVRSDPPLRGISVTILVKDN
jgi:hypothetical protein